jgi:hypothetical protein
VLAVFVNHHTFACRFSLEIRSVAGGDPGYEVQLDAVIQGLGNASASSTVFPMLLLVLSPQMLPIGTAESLKSLHLYENAEFDEECEANRVALYDGFLDVLSATGFTLNELRIDGKAREDSQILAKKLDLSQDQNIFQVLG